MYVVICDKPEGKPSIFSPFDSAEQAEMWIDTINNGGDECPNDHYWLEAVTPIIDFDIAETLAQ